LENRGLCGVLGNRGLGRVSGNRELRAGIGEQGIFDSVHRNKCSNLHGSMSSRIIISVVSEELTVFVYRVTELPWVDADGLGGRSLSR